METSPTSAQEQGTLTFSSAEHPAKLSASQVSGGGLSDPRGNLALGFVRLCQLVRPRWVLWENVPGVLSSGDGRDFGSILGALAELGYGFAFRVLDAQFFGVPQRRRRVFLVGYLGNWRPAVAVLFERESLRRHPAESRKARSRVARDAASGAGEGSGVVPFDTTQITSATNRSRPEPGDPSPTLARGAHPPAIAFHPTQTPITSDRVTPCLSRSVNGMGIAHTLTCHQAKGGDPTTDNYAITDYRVRRLTPRECERLQGFPDDYTLIPGASDGARYRALGNSMAVPVMRWIGERIAEFDR
jgi:DNA (cytosine-5)-methyltransferase 1